MAAIEEKNSETEQVLMYFFSHFELQVKTYLVKFQVLDVSTALKNWFGVCFVLISVSVWAKKINVRLRKVHFWGEWDTVKHTSERQEGKATILR